MANHETRKIIRALKQQGFTVEVKGHRHPKIFKDGKLVAQIPGTPSKYSSFANTIAGLRRIGFVYKGR
ncbi:hypothetical protein ACWDTT_15940 [Streptosporangium sandarakinum]